MGFGVYSRAVLLESNTPSCLEKLLIVIDMEWPSSHRSHQRSRGNSKDDPVARYGFWQQPVHALEMIIIHCRMSEAEEGGLPKSVLKRLAFHIASNIRIDPETLHYSAIEEMYLWCVQKSFMFSPGEGEVSKASPFSCSRLTKPFLPG